MNLFLTGATGFVGKEFLKYVKKKKIFIYAIGKKKNTKKIKFINKKIDEDFNNILKKCDSLLHLASAGVNNKKMSYIKMRKINVIQPLKLLENAGKNDCLNWIIAGSSSEYGLASYFKNKLNYKDKAMPTSNYGKTKYEFSKKAIQLSKKYNAKIIIMRIFPLYGEKEKSHRIFSLATKNAKTNKDTILFNGSQKRSFLHVKFAVRSLFKSIFMKKKSNKRNIWHIASRNSLTIEDFVKKIYKKYSSKGKIILKKNKINYDNNHHVSDVVSIWR